MKILVTCFLFLLFLPLSANAQDSAYYPIGQIVALEGSAWFVTGNNRSAVHVDDPVYMNATISTGADSKVLIVFIDDTQITLAANTELMIDSFIFDPYDAEENEASLQFTKGAFAWASGMLTKREKPEVKIVTPLGSIGIRGTQFWAGEIEDGYGVYVDEGLVGFKGEWGNAEIPGGEGIFIGRENRKSARRDFWTSERHAGAIRRVTFGNKEALKDKIKQRLRDNIRERHDYRGRMFPYKPGMRAPVYRNEKDGFFTDEFEEMREKR